MKVLRAEHVAAAAGPGNFPAGRLPEIAFLGRSNVGKSSLLNRLAGRRALARVSSTPGKTRLAHFYRLEGSRDSVLFVDLPGYGWARVSKSERAGWRRLVEDYLGDRAPLRGAVLLQDLRRDLSEDETLLLAWLAERGIPALLAVTKADKLPPMRRAERVRALAGAAGLPLGHVLATSARTGDGIPELWRVIEAWVRAPAGRHEEAGQR